MRSLITTLLLLVALGCSSGRSESTTSIELSFDIWDWTHPAQDLGTFEKWVEDLKCIGFNRVELSVPWRVVEPEPNRIELKWLRDRHAICKKHNIPMRLRINTHFGGAMPSWYDGAVWLDPNYKRAFNGRFPSIVDEKFRAHFMPVCTAIAAVLRGEDVLYSPFMGTHAEMKYGDWWTFDSASLELWRKSLQPPRPHWLARVVGDATLPTTPTVPATTAGLPDTSAEAKAFIAFREWTWREAAREFAEAIKAGDPDARISSPLGESYRAGSAQMCNLDYFGMTRYADQVVHSYDFGTHRGSTPLWHVSATVESFRGITGLPVSFEFDSPIGIEKTGYTLQIQKAVAKAALDGGAVGLKFANFSYLPQLPSEWPILAAATKLARTHKPRQQPEKNKTALLFFSKWANYCYREQTEWLHDAQFGWCKLLNDIDVPWRIVCEDNLQEDLSGYRVLIEAFSPRELMLEEDRRLLSKLTLPRVIEIPRVPDVKPSTAVAISGLGTSFTLPRTPFYSLVNEEHANAKLRSGEHAFLLPNSQGVQLGFPLGYCALHSRETTQLQTLARRVLDDVSSERRMRKDAPR